MKKNNPTSPQRVQQLLDALQKSVQTIATIREKDITKSTRPSRSVSNQFTSPESKIPSMRLFGLYSSASAFSGTGQYERTAEAYVNRVISVPAKSQRNNNRENINFGEINLLFEPLAFKERTVQREVQRELPREVVKEVQREIIRENNKEITREIVREMQREQQKEIQRELLKNLLRNPPTTSITTIPRINNPPNKKNPITLEDNRRRRNFNQFNKAYRVIIKTRGKKVAIGRALPRGKALQFGAEQLIRGERALSRSIELSEVGTTNELDIDFNPSPVIFRQYRIRKGQVVNTPNTIIQRQRKSLITPEEKELIRLSRLGIV